MKNLNEIETTKLRNKAEHVFQAMRLTGHDIGAFRTGICIMAVHSCILMNDAILVAMTGKRRIFKDHTEASRALERVCKTHGVKSAGGLRHLIWLLERKAKFSYTSDVIDDAEVKLAMDHAEKYFSWAYTTFKGVLRVEESS